jgi:hypothetical protein
VSSFLGTKIHLRKHCEANHGAAETKAVYVPLLQKLSLEMSKLSKQMKSCSERRGN